MAHVVLMLLVDSHLACSSSQELLDFLVAGHIGRALVYQYTSYREYMFVRTQEKKFYSHKNEKQQNCLSLESKLSKICFVLPNKL